MVLFIGPDFFTIYFRLLHIVESVKLSFLSAFLVLVCFGSLGILCTGTGAPIGLPS